MPTRRILLIIVLLGLGVAVAAAGYRVMHPDSTSHAPTAEAAAATKDRIAFTSEKYTRAGIEVAAVRLHKFQAVRTVSGEIEYNGTRHVSVKSPADGLVQKMSVLVGDQVKAGQQLAVINSPELGERRADVLQQEADLKLARRERDWWQSVESNVEDLISRLKRPQEIAALEEEFSDRVLGDYRSEIFSAYSKFRTAEAISTNLKAATSGTVSQRMILEQASTRDAAAAAFKGACEQVSFDVKQKVGKAKITYDDVARRLAVARQRLTWLTGASTVEGEGDQSIKDDALSIWPVTAPFPATVENVILAAAERVRQGEDILVLADTTKLWVRADIRDKDWVALTLSPGQQIQVQPLAMPGKTLDAKIAYVGRSVNADSRAAPLVADISNEGGLLRPGMFVHVLIPKGTGTESLGVPESALVRHEGRTFVFVQTGEREFAPRDVETGQTADHWIEITTGLRQGDQIAIKGVFHLKSELLLEPGE